MARTRGMPWLDRVLVPLLMLLAAVTLADAVFLWRPLAETVGLAAIALVLAAASVRYGRLASRA